MSEMIFTNSFANNPVYVMYPHKRRPSPFFELYVSREGIIREEDIEKATSQLIAKMTNDIKAGLWPRWTFHIEET
jgi:hypothetical protein